MNRAAAARRGRHADGALTRRSGRGFGGGGGGGAPPRRRPKWRRRGEGACGAAAADAARTSAQARFHHARRMRSDDGADVPVQEQQHTADVLQQHPCRPDQTRHRLYPRGDGISPRMRKTFNRVRRATAITSGRIISHGNTSSSATAALDVSYDRETGKEISVMALGHSMRSALKCEPLHVCGGLRTTALGGRARCQQRHRLRTIMVPIGAATVLYAKHARRTIAYSSHRGTPRYNLRTGDSRSIGPSGPISEEQRKQPLQQLQAQGWRSRVRRRTRRIHLKASSAASPARDQLRFTARRPSSSRQKPRHRLLGADAFQVDQSRRYLMARPNLTTRRS